MTTTETKAMTTPAPKDVAAKRPAHDLNDKDVTLRAGARATAAYKGGADILGGHGLVGTVWAVAEGKAIVVFTTSRGPAKVLANVADLEVR